MLTFVIIIGTSMTENITKATLQGIRTYICRGSGGSRGGSMGSMEPPF